jgi:hypothetical protein
VLDLPDGVRIKATAAGATGWLDDLPAIVASLERGRWLAQRTGRDETTIWEWGVVERMSTGLLCTQIGLQRHGRLLLAAADALAG